MDKSLHDLVENYYGTNAWKNATQAARKISRGASRRGQFWASGVSRFLRAILAYFRRIFQPNRAIICPSTVARCLKTGQLCVKRSAGVLWRQAGLFDYSGVLESSIQTFETHGCCTLPRHSYRL